ncbi:hypothetical protein GUJ93_ZPchr0006g45976 [Zizania palustris]|uniref:BHLH domain-containing protein n=1 Tax=Zizania palustris TaxID=103762 RepID=A0A8J5T899_ZIZPA|nr:hypothetical protein GUJ93_ZPchr0006g45976 [Zizania palustris]
MALVREPAMMYGGFESQLLGYGLDALVDVDAAALFGGYVVGAEADGTRALVADGVGWVGAGASSSVVAFDRAAQEVSEEAGCDAWIEAMDQGYADGEAPYSAATADVAFDAASGCFSLTERGSGAGRQFGLLFPSTSGGASSVRALPARVSQKRAYVVAQAGSESQTTVSPTKKKQCGGSRKTTKAKSSPTTPTKDPPQSLAAKNRRERISERLRILQELVPNGTKVDLVTMLEKAISYVKFLQLQVKVLATDEFWPAQGGKAPEISQVKEALDAILSSSTPLMGQLN